jgi:putative ATP-dependent endonuclease of OLD family
LRQGLSAAPTSDRKFLHQYLTLTRCDLFFADKAILVEGLSERLLVPIIIDKLESDDANAPKLSTQYVTIMEVGGAYAHLFFQLLEFLELRTLIITDLDSVLTPGGSACVVHEGTSSSNACLKAWFAGDAPVTLTKLLEKSDKDKVKEPYRIAYQCPETINGPCGRTFEDAFILANPACFNLHGTTPEELETAAYGLAGTQKKSAFALKYAIEELDWTPPKYIVDGIRWLAKGNTTAADDPLSTAAATTVGSMEGAPLAAS